MTEREQLQILWKTIDQLHTTAQGMRHGHFTADSLADYVERKTQEAMRAVAYPGEPPAPADE